MNTVRSLENILIQLIDLEPVFHKSGYPPDRSALEEMVSEDYFEISASGRTYARETVLGVVTARRSETLGNYSCKDFRILELATDTYLVSYELVEEKRSTLRTSIWKKAGGKWKILHHQGTLKS